MDRTLRRLALLLVAVCLLPMAAFADTIPVGFVSWDSTFPNNSGQFDISNQTGPNSTPAPDTTFPVTNPLGFSNLSLTVDFNNGTSKTFGASYFSPGADGLSFNGAPIAIGGMNPQPIDAILSGTFSSLTATLNNGSTAILLPTFSARISPTSGPFLLDGDLSVINATTASSASAPEPGTWTLLGAGLVGLGFTRRKYLHRIARTFTTARPHAGGLVLLFLISLIVVPFGMAAQLNLTTIPDNGVGGVTNVNLTATGIPAGTLTPANVVVTFSHNCGGSVVASEAANSTRHIIGSAWRININLPNLATGTYFIQAGDTSIGDANFSSSNCSQVMIAHTNPTLSACIPTSSLGVNAPASAGPVTAFVPNGAWAGGITGVQVVPIEGLGSPASVATPNPVNSCSSNPASGQTVCVANNTDVYELSGPVLTATLTSGSNSVTSFSGGSCHNCGVAINALSNKAVIAMGLAAPSGSGIQMLDLNTNTFDPPIPLSNHISEDISIDPTRGLILSANESNIYDLLQIQADGSHVNEFGHFFSSGGEPDSSAEDCTTGIALASVEFTNNVYLADLTQATFGAGTWTAPEQLFTLSVPGFSAGTSGISVAPGSSHQAIVTGEFGGNAFAVLQLPSTSGTSTPTILDYAYASITGFTAGLDPHTVTAYTSPNDGLPYALMANQPPPSQLARINMSCILAKPRSPGTHNVTDTVGCINFIPTH